MNTNFKSPCPILGNVLHLGKWKRSALKQTRQLMWLLCERNGLSKVRLAFVRSLFIRIVKCWHKVQMIFSFDYGLIKRGKVRPQFHYSFFFYVQAARYFSSIKQAGGHVGGGGYTVSKQANFHMLLIEFILYFNAWGNKIIEFYYSSLSYMFFFVDLFPQALVPSMNIDIFKYWSIIIYRTIFQLHLSSFLLS